MFTRGLENTLGGLVQSNQHQVAFVSIRLPPWPDHARPQWQPVSGTPRGNGGPCRRSKRKSFPSEWQPEGPLRRFLDTCQCEIFPTLQFGPRQFSRETQLFGAFCISISNELPSSQTPARLGPNRQSDKSHIRFRVKNPFPAFATAEPHCRQDRIRLRSRSC